MEKKRYEKVLDPLAAYLLYLRSIAVKYVMFAKEVEVDGIEGTANKRL